MHYPLDDLMSVLALESERHACLVVGEDLGTVPPRDVAARWTSARSTRYRVLLFEKQADGSFRRPEEYPRRAIATVTTHDLPTLRGYWAGSDIELRERLPLYPSEESAGRCERAGARPAMRCWPRSRPAACSPPDASARRTRTTDLARAIHLYLARSAAALVVLQTEDLIGMADPVNVPGTSDEHANWQRKMSCGIDDILAHAVRPRLLDEVQ